jgi:hypothetical protein
VTRDPSDIGHASEFVGLGVDIENVFHGEETTEKVAGCRVDDSLGFTGRARGLGLAR